MSTEVGKFLALGIMCGLSFGLVGIGQGLIGSKTLEAIGRNPEADGILFTRMLIAMAVAESLAIYALVVTFILLFAL